jgi:EF hand
MSTTKIFSGLLAVTLTSAALYAAPGMTADANGDKAVTKTEALAAADAHFAKMDANGDGMLNEADKAAMVKKHFAEMDADKNGAINEAEFVAAHEARADKRDERHEMRMGHGGHEGKMGRHGGGCWEWPTPMVTRRFPRPSSVTRLRHALPKPIPMATAPSRLTSVRRSIRVNGAMNAVPCRPNLKRANELCWRGLSPPL